MSSEYSQSASLLDSVKTLLQSICFIVSDYRSSTKRRYTYCILIISCKNIIGMIISVLICKYLQRTLIWKDMYIQTFFADLKYTSGCSYTPSICTASVYQQFTIFQIKNTTGFFFFSASELQFYPVCISFVNLTWLKSRASRRFRRQTKYRRIRL